MPYVFNPLTGNLDAVRSKVDGMTEDEVRALILAYINGIVTSDRNALGNLNFVYDPVECKYVEMQPLPVTDENGNIVVEEPE